MNASARSSEGGARPAPREHPQGAAAGEPSDGLRQAVARKGSFGQTAKAVAWSFFGVRKSSDHADDLSRLNPLHVIVAGVAGAVLFVVVLVLVVRWVTTGVAG